MAGVDSAAYWVDLVVYSVALAVSAEAEVEELAAEQVPELVAWLECKTSSTVLQAKAALTHFSQASAVSVA